MKIALVTGAGSGIGRALALALARGGHTVIVTDLLEEAAAETAEEIQQRGGVAKARGLDVTKEEAFARLVNDVIDSHGGVDLLVNNAGVGTAGEVSDLRPENWEPVLDVNLRGTIHGIHAVYPHMVAAGRGTILNIASGAGLCPRPGMVPYAAAKHAVVGLSTSLRAEAAARGVRVSVACPGYIATGILGRTEYVGVDGLAIQASLQRMPIRPMPAETCARRILRGLRRNRAVMPIGGGISLEWILYRWFPGLVHRLARLRARKFREAAR